LRVKKFPDWLKSNRTSKSLYTKDLPYKDTEYSGSSNYGGGMPTAFSIAGDYMFFCYGMGHIRIMKRSDGGVVGTIKQNTNGYTGSDGQVDCAYGMNAYKRANGEYVLLFENAGYASIVLLRWCPAGSCVGPDSVIPDPDVSEIAGAPSLIDAHGMGVSAIQRNGNYLSITGLPVGRSTVKIADLNGRTIFKTVANDNSVSIDTRKISRGLYVVTFGNNAMIESRTLNIR
jgi:hypothetical protein